MNAASTRKDASLVPFVAALAGVVGLGVVGYLGLTTVVNERAYEVQDLNSQAKVLGYEIIDLESQLTQVSSATSLGMKAQELGMVPNPNSVLLGLDGKVIGKAKATVGNEIPSTKYLTQEERSARREAVEAEAKAKKEAAAAKKAAEAAKKAEEEAAKKAQAEAEAQAQAQAEAEAQAQAEQPPVQEGNNG
ncbi:MAG: hypothetical protein LBR21_02165 [Propionibacteriaceae bacterium]|jgi:hypothetical protein|nr:hypothetical protein [Propionibacteriaceae bacterium]